MYNLDQYRGTSVSCRYSIPKKLADVSSQHELIRVVESAVIDTVLKHPVLQVAIAVAHSKNPSWTQLETISMRHHVTWNFDDYGVNLDDDLQALIAKEVDTKFCDLDHRPGWRIVIIHPQQTSLLEIVFTWNHPHCDGTSGKIFHSSLLQSLNSATPAKGSDGSRGAESTPVFRLPDSVPRLPPPIEQICKLPLSLPFILKTIWDEAGPTALTAKPTLANWAPIPSPGSPFKTQVRAFTIGVEQLEKILHGCRQHKTTLTGLLHALTFASLASKLAAEAAPALASGTTIDMRRYVGKNPKAYPWLEPDMTMGNFVTIMTHEFRAELTGQIRSHFSKHAAPSEAVQGGVSTRSRVLSDELVDMTWSTAARVRRELESRIDLGLKDDMVGIMKLVGDWQREMVRIASRPRPHSWWVTGIGVLDGGASAVGQYEHGSSNDAAESKPQPVAQEGDNNWIIRRAQFALSTETPGAAIIISPMTAAGECLCVCGSWQDCLFDAGFGEGVMADLENWLNQLACA